MFQESEVGALLPPPAAEHRACFHCGAVDQSLELNGDSLRSRWVLPISGPQDLGRPQDMVGFLKELVEQTNPEAEFRNPSHLFLFALI